MAVWRRRIAIAIVTLAVVGAVIYGFLPRPVAVDVATVGRGALRVTVEEEGKTRVKDRFLLSVPVPGVIRRIRLDVGDSVETGQVLAVLEPMPSRVLDPRSRAEAEARLAAAEAALRAAEETARATQAEDELAQAGLRRVSKLFESGDVSREDLDRVETQARRTRANLRSAQFAVDVAHHDVEAARTALRYSAAEPGAAPAETVEIGAPVAGSVLRIPEKSERVVQGGEPILEIGDPSALEVEIDVLSADAVRIGPGTRVWFERWGGGEPLEGRVRRVEPVGFTKISALGVEEQRVLVIADFVGPREQWERLGDGYRVEAVFVIWEGEDVLQVPTSALFRWREKWAVFVVNDGEAARREVEIGHQSGLQSEVRSGLQPGDVVIVHPDNAIADGVLVTPRQT